MNCLVICRGDAPELRYMLATRSIFPSREMAEMYAAGCAPDREPMVIECPLGTDLLSFEQAHPWLFQEYMKRLRLAQREAGEAGEADGGAQ